MSVAVGPLTLQAEAAQTLVGINPSSMPPTKGAKAPQATKACASAGPLNFQVETVKAPAVNLSSVQDGATKTQAVADVEVEANLEV